MRGSVSAPSPREKKRLAPSNPRSSVSSATVCAIVDFPIPANPFNQNIGGVLGSGFSIHALISCKIACQVPSKHVFRALRLPELWLACSARGRESKSLACSGEQPINGSLDWNRKSRSCLGERTLARVSLIFWSEHIPINLSPKMEFCGNTPEIGSKHA